VKINKIYVVVCTHGNEIFGLKVLAHIQRIYSNQSVVAQVAHPEAVAKRKRYIQTDLNRSFKLPPGTSTEAVIAKRLVNDIERFNPDLIIDLHTSTVDVGQVAILAENTPFLTNVAKHLGMQNAALMHKDIAGLSLIGAFPHRSICVELGKGHRSDALAKQLAKRINNLIGVEVQDYQIPLPLFIIERVIKHIEVSGLELTNYVFNEKLAGYPFLTGEKNYSEHRGFLATSQIEV
jgi:succinylglutamate desuccinylase